MHSRFLTVAACALASFALALPLHADVKLGRQGVSAGMWDLPNLTQPGIALGRLLNEDGDAVLQLGAKLIPESSSPGVPARHGRLAGVLSTLPAPGQTEHIVAYLRGNWSADLAGNGTWRALIVRPDGFGGSEFLGEIQGAFDDDLGGPLNTIGAFKATWRIR